MTVKGSVIDNFPNRAIQRITMSAANTFTLQEVNFQVTMMQNIALLLQRVEYYCNAGSLREIVAANDNLDVGISLSGQITTADMNKPEILDKLQIVGVGVSVEPHVQPYVKDFTTMSGGGLLVPSKPVYLFATTGGFVGAAVVDVQFYFTYVELKPEQYLELMQTRIQSNF